MKELKSCTLLALKEGNNLQEEITAKRNTVTSYILHKQDVYGYSGSQPLDYPWINGYRIVRESGR